MVRHLQPPRHPFQHGPHGTNTCGGYSTTLVVPEDFMLKIPAGLNLQHRPDIELIGIARVHDAATRCRRAKFALALSLLWRP